MTRPHVITEVHFQAMAEQGRPMSEAPLRCSCGTWTTSGEWERHRGPSVDQERVARNHRAWIERQEAAA